MSDPIDRLFRTTLGPPTTVGTVLQRRVALLDSAKHDNANDDNAKYADARQWVAREHGFADWAAVLAEADRPVDPRFEAAVDALVDGDEDALRALLDADPVLVRARSAFGHHATLVHYLAANGVETSRQGRTPGNAVVLLRLLLDRGADPDATCDTYGGGPAQTPLCLLVSSVHPARAGVQGDLVEALCLGGADPDGLDRDGLPMWTAITFGYPVAVEALARSGARIDNLVFAAALGDLDLVERYVREARYPDRIGARGPALDPAHGVGYALIYAAGLGRRDAVELLLRQQPDRALVEPLFGATAAGAARYHGYPDVEALLS